MNKYRIHSIAVGTMLFAFAVFAAIWFCLFNRYFVLHYHEQMQLFRFDGLYFRSYLDTPGGLAGYLGSFLTQFYYYPVVGCIIIAAVLSAVFLLSYHIFRNCGNIWQLFFIPFIPAVLLMMSFVNIHFDMSMALGFLFALASFRLYILLSLPVRYIAGLTLVFVLYFIAGGNALLLAVLILIFETIVTKPMKGKDLQKKCLYLLSLFVCLAVLPWIAWQYLYTVPIRAAYFALTPVDFLFPTTTNKVLWLSIPVLYLIWKLMATKINHLKISLWKILVFNSVIVILITSFGAHSAHDGRGETLNRMVYDLQRGKWESVMTLGKNFPSSNRLVCYLTNIALAESGQMPHNMFQYRQIGTSGLFLDWQLTYFAMWYSGEIYYRLGMIPEAEHSAFEALSSNERGPKTQTLQRLVLTNIARRDSATADKYLKFFENSFVYRKWAQQQRANLASAMADSSFLIPNMPLMYNFDDFFITYRHPDYALQMLLISNPQHRMAFEYLMSFYMLLKDIEQVKWCLDQFYENFDYPEIPIHYEEVIVAYHNATQADDDIFDQYPVKQTTRDRFEQYIQAFRAAQGSRRNFELLEKQFGNTYWFYVHFINPSTIQSNNEQNRY